MTLDFGIAAKGRGEIRKYMDGKRLTSRQAIRAKCYDCMGGYTDGKYSCNIPLCSLFPFSPYKDVARKS